MSRRPVNPPINITTGFGVPDSDSKFGKHTGVDYAKPIGTPIYAPANGKIVALTVEQWNGWVVHLFDGKYYHRMLHNSHFSVSVGQVVREGQQVAVSGNSGLSTGAHCHWDICTVEAPTSFSQFIDPAKWLTMAPPTPPKPTYPRWVTVRVPVLNVRSQPSTNAPLAGSGKLTVGTKVEVAAVVQGQSIAGNPRWYKSMFGHYIWQGGVS